MAGLEPSARRGYGLGSVATGSFGTVPGLLLLPYLTDRLGVTAALAGLVVFLPKAWDVILNPDGARQCPARRGPTRGSRGVAVGLSRPVVSPYRPLTRCALAVA
ncbi:MFS transporter [Aestuariimicrobium ganziense]|uniref:MFS transporter n=1 Tax=Aestuariimicrobium ganziense TaxID=2773677 RepID=UPI0019434693|nr:MFS transporter [Aestuariimicrobium ganziense]